MTSVDPKVGICGTGRMGTAIGLRLLESGVGLAVWNRTAQRAEALLAEGASRVESPKSLAQEADVIISMLFDDDAVSAAYGGQDGLTTGDLKGKTVIEMSTITRATVEALNDQVRAAGGAFVECPVGGTVPPARNGQLVGIAAGAQEEISEVRPILDLLCRSVTPVGPIGSAAIVKLAVNLPLMVYFEALGEALALIETAGIDREAAGALLADSSGAAKVAPLFMPGILASIAGNRPDTVFFDLNGAMKDLRLTNSALKEMGVDAPVLQATSKAYAEAIADGWGEVNYPLLPAWRATKHTR